MSKLRVRLKTEDLLGGGLESGEGMVRKANARGAAAKYCPAISIFGVLNQSRDYIIVCKFVLVEAPRLRINNSHARAHEQSVDCSHGIRAVHLKWHEVA